MGHFRSFLFGLFLLTPLPALCGTQYIAQGSTWANCIGNLTSKILEPTELNGSSVNHVSWRKSVRDMYSTGPLVQTLYSITARNGAETLSGWMYALMTYKGKGTYLCDINTTNLNHPRAFYIVSNNNRHYELNWSSRAPDTVFNWLSDHIPRPQLPGMNLFMGEGPPY